MKEQQKRKNQQFHPEIEDGTDLRRWPLIKYARSPSSLLSTCFHKALPKARDFGTFVFG